MQNQSKINLDEYFGRFSDHWRPKIVAESNGQHLKLVKLQGTFPWHTHEHEDELFLVWRGKFRVEFRDHIVQLNPGEALVVPRGTEHRAAADGEAEILIFEPASTRNTGNVQDEHFTAPQDTWLLPIE
jgi:mannose-6-phosphate isomerase-like protein (cupin superfamily)